MSNTERIQAHNAELREAIEMAEKLPEAGGVADPVIEPLEITENGTCTAPDGVDGYSPVTVNVPIPDGYIKPSGELEVTENGTHDVTEYTSVNVNVETDTETDDTWIGDGDTHIWITINEVRKSPMLGVCPNGTVTVDWGDGTTPDVLTGTSESTTKLTPSHEYAEPGDYIITLSVDGKCTITGTSNGSYLLIHGTGSDTRNYAYRSTIKKVEIGNDISNIGNYAFYHCYCLESVYIPDGITSLGIYAFYNCYSLRSLVIPNGVISIGNYAFRDCHALSSITIPDSLTTFGANVFYSCYSLASVYIPDGITNINTNQYVNCRSITAVVIPGSVTNIAAGAFSNAVGVLYYDFTNHTVVPTLAAETAFTGIPVDCEIRVPAALYDEWITATNWSVYANKIRAIEDYPEITGG